MTDTPIRDDASNAGRHFSALRRAINRTPQIGVVRATLVHIFSALRRANDRIPPIGVIRATLVLVSSAWLIEAKAREIWHKDTNNSWPRIEIPIVADQASCVT